MENLSKFIDINKRLGFPRKYTFRRSIRITTLSFGILAILYAFWIIFFKIGSDTTRFFKIAPFIIIFFAANSVMRNLFSLNSIEFHNDRVIFGYLGRKAVIIHWNTIRKMMLEKGKHRQIKLVYESGGAEKDFTFSISFPNMLEIVNSIAEMCPDIECDDFIRNVLITDEEKAKFSK